MEEVLAPASTTTDTNSSHYEAIPQGEQGGDGRGKRQRIEEVDDQGSSPLPHLDPRLSASYTRTPLDKYAKHVNASSVETLLLWLRKKRRDSRCTLSCSLVNQYLLDSIGMYRIPLILQPPLNVSLALITT